FPKVIINFIYGINSGYILDHYKLRVNPGYQNLFIMRSVKNGNHPLGWQLFINSPQKVMLKLRRRRSFKAFYFTALRVNTAHNMFYCSILSSCIHSLEYY